MRDIGISSCGVAAAARGLTLWSVLGLMAAAQAQTIQWVDPPIVKTVTAEVPPYAVQPGVELRLEQSLTAATANGKYNTLLRQIERPEDAGQYGDFKDFGLFEGAEWNGIVDPPQGFWVYVRPYWYVWRDLAAAPRTSRAWGPEQVTGAPNTAATGDAPTAWASRTPDDENEWLLLEYDKPRAFTSIKVYESFNPGAVSRVTAFSLDGREVELWKGVDPTRGVKGIGVLSLQCNAPFKTNRVKLYLSSPTVPGWNEIDAVGLLDAAGAMHWATSAVASSTYARRDAVPAPVDQAAIPLREGLPEGSFEPTTAAGQPAGWRIVDPDNVKIVEEEDNHFLRLTNRKKELLAAPNDFRLDPTWKRIRVQARIRGLGLRSAGQPWENARLQYWFEDAVGNKVGPWQKAMELKFDAEDWITFRSEAKVPPSAKMLRISPEMLNTSGQADYDDIKVTQAPAWLELPMRDGFPEGTFESVDAHGNPAGWILDDPERVTVATEGGNHFLRLTNTTTADSVNISAAFKLDPTWKQLKIRVRMRGTHIKVGPNPEDRPRLAYEFINDDGAIGPWISSIPTLEHDADWTTQEVAATVPPGTTLLVLRPEMVSSSGTTDFDDIQIVPVPGAAQP